MNTAPSKREEHVAVVREAIENGSSRCGFKEDGVQVWHTGTGVLVTNPKWRDRLRKSRSGGSVVQE